VGGCRGGGKSGDVVRLGGKAGGRVGDGESVDPPRATASPTPPPVTATTETGMNTAGFDRTANTEYESIFLYL
jgi:hypothetical protein